jgi:hypothetical protein
MQSEILHGLGGLENDVAKFLMLLLDIGHHGMFDADAHLRDCLPSLVTRGSDHQPDIYLLRHGAVDGGEGIYVIMVLGSVVLDDVTQPVTQPGHMVVHARHDDLVLGTKWWGFSPRHHKRSFVTKNICL